MSHTTTSAIVGCVTAAGLAVSASAQPQVTNIPGFALQSWNAGTEVEGRADWHSEAPAASWFNGLRWDWQANTMSDGSGDVIPPSLVPVCDPAVPGISAAFQFPEARAATILPDGTGNRGANWEGQATVGESATHEIWFKPADLTGIHVLLEIGAGNKGVAFVLDDNELLFAQAANDGMGGNSYIYEHRETLTDTAWRQAVIVISYADFTVTSYLDGAFVNSMPIPPSGNYRWTSGNPAGLGTLAQDPLFPAATIAGDLIPAGDFTDFDGLISTHRFYDVDLFAFQVADNYEAFTDADATTRRADFNGDGAVDFNDKLDMVTFFENATTAAHGDPSFPFPADDPGGVQVNDPFNDQAWLGDFHWNRDDGFNPTGAQEPSFQFNAINVLEPVPVNDPAVPAVRTAFVLDGVEGFRGPKFEQADDSGNSGRTQAWVFFDDVTGNHCVYELGGSGVGFAVYAIGDELVATINTSANDGLDVAELSSGAGALTPGWHFIETIVRRTPGTTGEGYELYLDGVQVAAINDDPGPDMMFGTADDIDNFSSGGAGNSNFIGGNQGGYGTIFGTSPLPAGFVAGDFTPLNGLAGPFRHIATAPTPATVAAEYAADGAQPVIDARNDADDDGAATFFDVLKNLSEIDAGL